MQHFGRANFFRRTNLRRTGPNRPVTSLGLSTSCSRLPKKLPVISQKVAQKLLKKSQKLPPSLLASTTGKTGLKFKGCCRTQLELVVKSDGSMHHTQHRMQYRWKIKIAPCDSSPESRATFPKWNNGRVVHFFQKVQT